jgi:hypothetical protein
LLGALSFPLFAPVLSLGKLGKIEGRFFNESTMMLRIKTTTLERQCQLQRVNSDV